eukprot:1144300-Pelagomonas_calceolata.AAC.1
MARQHLRQHVSAWNEQNAMRALVQLAAGHALWAGHWRAAWRPQHMQRHLQGTGQPLGQLALVQIPLLRSRSTLCQHCTEDTRQQ